MASIAHPSGTLKGGDKMADYLSDMRDSLTDAKSVKVGFLEGATYPDEKHTPVAFIAAIQNFGAPKVGIPPRPFFSNMVREQSPTWGGRFAKIMRQTSSARMALELLGEGIKGQLQESIKSSIWEPNSPVTNLLKQRFPMAGQTYRDVLQARADVRAGATAPAGKPLTWTGHMLNSIGVEVE